ncbi:MAG TPA: chromosomal replication initiator protein DnaA, partial [Candidatus Hydrogenedentes bacterium]|nr:chromosomal replication initiator protein DnaA [Candidatus Hydrogenedentota bacterium]
QEALAGLADRLQAAPAAAAQPQADAGGSGISEAIRESITTAMEDAIATLMVQLRAMAGRRDGEGGGQIPAELAQAVREGVLEAQAAQGERLNQIAESMLASVRQVSQLVEASAVASGNAHELAASGPRKYLSVTPFGRGGEGPAEEYAEADAQVVEAMESERPVEMFTFETFFPGKANVFTHQVGLAVAEHPGGEYNPFFLYGDVGVGKTHLISAIGNAVLRGNPKARVGYVSASRFSRRLSDAMRTNALDAFRENYCHWDMLILDDIQFLGGRVEAQEEFFHIFNVLRQQHRQIIIASDKAPDRLGLLEQRLVSRFASGIVAQLKAPEWETRMEILRHAAQEAGAPVPEAVLSLISMRVQNDVRKMTGALRKVVAFAKLVGQEMTCELAEEILSHLGVEVAA